MFTCRVTSRRLLQKTPNCVIGFRVSCRKQRCEGRQLRVAPVEPYWLSFSSLPLPPPRRVQPDYLWSWPGHPGWGRLCIEFCLSRSVWCAGRLSWRSRACGSVSPGTYLIVSILDPARLKLSVYPFFHLPNAQLLNSELRRCRDHNPSTVYDPEALARA